VASQHVRACIAALRSKNNRYDPWRRFFFINEKTMIFEFHAHTHQSRAEAFSLPCGTFQHPVALLSTRISSPRPRVWPETRRLRSAPRPAQLLGGHSHCFSHTRAPETAAWANSQSAARLARQALSALSASAASALRCASFTLRLAGPARAQAKEV
jgi:hypothetical protein